MPDVYNWQLGRPMAYRFPEAHPEWQFAFVFNINRCLACQTCTMACKATWTFSEGQEHMWWNNVETKPYGGYPRGWDSKLLAMLEEANPGGQTWDVSRAGPDAPYGRYRGQTIFEAARARGGADEALGYLPADDEWAAPNVWEDTATGTKGRPGVYGKGAELPVHTPWFFYLQRLCNHCTYPACLAACPRNAIYKRNEDGIVLIDQSRCRGYRKCVEQCPYKKPMYRATTRVSEKCVGCYPRVEGTDPLTEGLPMETRCMAVCPGKIRMQGLVKIAKDGSWEEDPENPIYYLVKVAKVGLPLYPQFGDRAERLLHPAAVGAAGVPRADVRARGWTRRSRPTRRRRASSSRSSPCSGPPRRSSSSSGWRRARRCGRRSSTAASGRCTTTPRSATTATARRSFACRWSSPSTSGRGST
ncbi:MAG: hypothetical protein KatS3mg014_0683 [Actinomycetota bacterium]|nr:MAG: hypothetical protein KatS3mg014_0683 [Actinomycetota bacterium]